VQLWAALDSSSVCQKQGNPNNGKPLSLDAQKRVEALAHSGGQSGNSPLGFGHGRVFIVRNTGDDQGGPCSVWLGIDPAKMTRKSGRRVIGEVTKRTLLGPDEKPILVEFARKTNSSRIKNPLQPDAQQGFTAFGGRSAVASIVRAISAVSRFCQ
jgi:hypothetical protein